MKVGFLHIQKCAGTAISSALYDAFEMKPTPLRRIVDPGKVTNNHSELERKSLAMRLARNLPFISGHLTFPELKQLDRDFIFTILRDPKERIFSSYTSMVSRANDPRILKKNPKRISYTQKSFIEMFNRGKPNRMTARMLGDIPEVNNILKTPYGSRSSIFNNANAINIIDNGLQRYSMILAGRMKSISRHLEPITRTGKIRIETLNTSRSDIAINMGCTESEFASLLQSQTWLDELIFERSTELFPKHVETTPKSTKELISDLKSRYELRFT